MQRVELLVQTSEPAPENSSTSYQPPKIVPLGKSSEAIRGNWTSGVWDQGQGGPQWYVSGE